jgi:hypothetical protein
VSARTSRVCALASLKSDLRTIPRLRAGAAVDVLLLRRSVRSHACRPKHRRRGAFLFFFMFRPRPTHHASAQLRSQHRATRTPSARSTTCRSRPPRGVTVFAERSGETGAARPQKRRRHFPPSHRLWVHASHPHVSPTHAPSRRLQRVSVAFTHALRGQASRRRPPDCRSLLQCSLTLAAI